MIGLTPIFMIIVGIVVFFGIAEVIRRTMFSKDNSMVAYLISVAILIGIITLLKKKGMW